MCPPHLPRSPLVQVSLSPGTSGKSATFLILLTPVFFFFQVRIKSNQVPITLNTKQTPSTRTVLKGSFPAEQERGVPTLSPAEEDHVSSILPARVLLNCPPSHLFPLFIFRAQACSWVPSRARHRPALEGDRLAPQVHMSKPSRVVLLSLSGPNTTPPSIVVSQGPYSNLERLLEVHKVSVPHNHSRQMVPPHDRHFCRTPRPA